ncbi:hypothetical protein O3G_MSEX006291, partial [Manduca sexta]
MLPLILFFVILLAYWWWKQYRLNLTEPPSFPGAWPIIGHIHLILGDDLYLWRTVNEMVDTSFMMGGVGSAFIGPRTVYDVIGDSDRDIEKQDLSQLVYLEAVLKESMRVYTIVPIIARKLDKNVKLKRCTLKAGRTCFMFLFGIHRHPVWGPDADQFKPERWLDPSTLPDTPNAFTGFGVGRRMCIGK